MEWIALVNALSPLILGFMSLVATSKKEGAVKKEKVVGMTKKVVSKMDDVSTGGQKETWKALEPILVDDDGIIEGFYELFFQGKDEIVFDEESHG